MKRIISIIIICIWVSLYSSGKQNELIVFRVDGEAITFVASESLKIEFKDNTLNLKSANDECNVLLDRVMKIEFRESQTSALALSKANAHEIVFVTNEEMKISNIKGLTKVVIYSIGGDMVVDQTIADDYLINLTRLQKGVYILTINGQSKFKFIKR